MDSANNAPKGIGGWLILPILALIITPFSMIFQFYRDLMPVLTLATWTALTKPDSPAYHPLWGPLIVFEIVANLVLFAFILWLLWLFFTKSKHVPKLFIVWLLLLPFMQIGDYLLSVQIPTLAANPDPEVVTELARSIVAAAIWIPYFIRSKRVKNTFIEPATIGRHHVDSDEIIELTDVVVVGRPSSHLFNDEIKTASNRSYLKYVLAIAVVVFFTVAIIFSNRPPTNIPESLPVIPATTPSWPDIIKKAKRSVVTINTPTSIGSGFISSSDGLIITNTHVVSNNDTVEVIFYNGEKKLALVTKYGTPPLDIALLKVSGSNFEWLQLSNPTDCEQGAEIIALGSPQGFDDSITKGIISNCDRDFNGVKYIQTDTAINPGNSGGPVINKEGKIIGISTLMYNDSQGLNFLVSAVTIKAFIKGELEGLAVKLAALEEDRVRREQFAKEQTEKYAVYIYDQLWNALLIEDRQYSGLMSDLVYAGSKTLEAGMNNLEIKRIPPTGYTSLSDWIAALAVRILKKELTYEEAVKLIKGHYA